MTESFIFSISRFQSVLLLLFTLSLVSLTAPSLRAENTDLAIQVDDKAKGLGKEAVDDSKYGKGTKEETEIEFKVKLLNMSEKEQAGVSLRLIPFFLQHGWGISEDKQEPGKIQELGPITLTVREEKNLEFAKVKIFEQQTYDPKERTRWRSGEEYMGCVVELIQNGQKILFRVSGDVRVRKAYEAFSESKK